MPSIPRLGAYTSAMTACDQKVSEKAKSSAASAAALRRHSTPSRSAGSTRITMRYSAPTPIAPSMELIMLMRWATSPNGSHRLNKKPSQV